jgi:peptide deformylase
VAVRPILLYENPRLRMKSIKVKRIDQSIQTLIDDMIETMRGANGIGLAAPQVGVLLRVIIAEYTDEETEGVHQQILVNPEITAKEGDWMAEEGCLSIPGFVGTVPRAERVAVRGKDRNGKLVRLKTDGVLAHILQHEIDHLDGVLYIDYLDSLDELRPVEPGEKRRRRRRAAGEDEDEQEEAATDGIEGPTEAEPPIEAAPRVSGGSDEPPGVCFDPCCAAGRSG